MWLAATLCLRVLLCSCANNLIRQVVLGKQMWPLASGLWLALAAARSTAARAHFPRELRRAKKRQLTCAPWPVTQAVARLHRISQRWLHAGARGAVEPAHVAREQPRALLIPATVHCYTPAAPGEIADPGKQDPGKQVMPAVLCLLPAVLRSGS